MPPEKEPREKPAEKPPRDTVSGDSMSLVDFFDKMGRAAFRRSLEFRNAHRLRPGTD